MFIIFHFIKVDLNSNIYFQQIKVLVQFGTKQKFKVLKVFFTPKYNKNNTFKQMLKQYKHNS